jgi:LSD1 subclass zinc finger protein
MLCIVAGRGSFIAAMMNPTRMFQHYADGAKAADCSTCRTVNMLGMMCAAAVDNGGFLAFVGQGYGGDWPDPRDVAGGPRRGGRSPGALKT